MTNDMHAGAPAGHRIRGFSGKGLRRADRLSSTATHLADSFSGLPNGISRWRLAAALRKAAKPLGLTDSMLRLLHLYIDLSYDVDWTAGNEPVITHPLLEIAEQLGRSERQIRNIEKALVGKGLLAWRDSGNHHRKGRRDRKTGRLLYAYGPSLAPLGQQAEAILHLEAEAKRHATETRRCRMAIAALRRRIRAALATLDQTALCRPDDERLRDLVERLEGIPERNPAGTGLSTLDHHRATLLIIAETLDELAATVCGISPKPAGDTPTHIQIPESESINGICNAPDHTARPTGHTPGTNQNHGLDQIAIATAIAASGPLIHADISTTATPTWTDLIAVAYRHAPLYGIDASQWAAACRAMGRKAAALSILLIEHGSDPDRASAAPIVDPPAYLAAMGRRARLGTLRLDRSILSRVRHAMNRRQADSPATPTREKQADTASPSNPKVIAHSFTALHDINTVTTMHLRSAHGAGRLHMNHEIIPTKQKRRTTLRTSYIR